MLERNKHIIWGAVFGVVVLGVLVILLLCCISCLCYKMQMTRVILREPSKVLDTYLEQIKKESVSEKTRIKLIDEVRKLTKEIVNYHKKRQRTTPDTSGNSQEKRKTNICCCINHSRTAHAATTAVQGENGIELSKGPSRISDDGTAHGPPPSHLSSKLSPPTLIPATSDKNGIEGSCDRQGSTVSLVDKALNEFVRDLQSITE